MRKIRSIALAALLLGAQSCGEADDGPSEGTEASELALDSARARVVQEASYAMTGSYATYAPDDWPTMDTYARYDYTLTDRGAWNLLLDSPSYGYGRYVSCMAYRSQGWLYAPCGLSASAGYGSFEMPYYTCQGSCPSARMRGGQCKAFMNLVAYRSGRYQGPGYAFKAFPPDAAIAKWSTASDQMPYATYADILPGDFLQRPDGHALIVVRKISASQVVVFDSNWLDGDGAEVVGSHTLGFSGSGDSDLGNYRVLKCAYDGGC